MTSELRPAMAVAEDCHWEFEFKSEEEAAAVIEKDREAVRAEQAAEVAELRSMLLDLLAVVHRDGGHRTQEIGRKLAWEQAMLISSERIAELAKFKALAETLAGAGAAIIKLIGPKDCRLYASDSEVVAMVNILRKYKEARDA